VKVKKPKRGERDCSSGYKYSLELDKGLGIFKTRLVGIEWSLRKRKAAEGAEDLRVKKATTTTSSSSSSSSNSNSNSGSSSSSSQAGTALTNTKYILAPMVGASELAFRLLCRRYGTTLAYTPMINSERFAVDAAYRKQEFQVTAQDRPLVCHFSANDPSTFLKAAQFVEHECDAIDLNLGCPQRVAAQGHYGSFLLDPVDRPLVLDMVRTGSKGISIPMFVKIRLLNSIEETVRTCPTPSFLQTYTYTYTSRSPTQL
jgi:hypothetical protein